MNSASRVDASNPRILDDPREATRAFNLSMVVSGIRCTISYVLLPFVTPFIGLAPGVGPALGIPIGMVALVANGLSLRRFWKLQHPWRRPVTVLHVLVMALLVFLIASDVSILAASP
ncbi:MAG: hypothetical protein ACE5F5_12135 [Acidimicrobiia bacterium]